MARKLWIVVLFVLSAILFVFFMCGSLFVRITGGKQAPRKKRKDRGAWGFSNVLFG